MSNRTPNQDKALLWFTEKNGLKPQFSTHPTYYFLKKNGEEIKYNIITILASWERYRKEKAKND